MTRNAQFITTFLVNCFAMESTPGCSYHLGGRGRKTCVANVFFFLLTNLLLKSSCQDLYLSLVLVE